jgi:hypothetical protein
MGEKLYTLYME